MCDCVCIVTMSYNISNEFLRCIFVASFKIFLRCVSCVVSYVALLKIFLEKFNGKKYIQQHKQFLLNARIAFYMFHR